MSSMEGLVAHFPILFGDRLGRHDNEDRENMTWGDCGTVNFD